MSRASELADDITPSKDNVPELGNLLDAAAELRRLDRVNAELVAQNEAQKNEWLAWDSKRMSLERDAARYRWLRDKADEGKNWEPMVFSCSSRAPINWADSLHGADLDAAVDAALTSATKEQP